MIPTVWTDVHRRHTSGGEVWLGVPIPGDETPERAEEIKRVLEEAGGRIMPPVDYPDEVLESVHTPDFVDFLRSAWAQWQRSNYPDDPGQTRVVGYAFPIAKLTSGRPVRRPASIGALTGLYAIDTMTPIGEGTWEAARAAAMCAITAADLVLEGTPSAYAAVRPPGHHAGPGFYGGSCYLNNAALAAQRLRTRGVPTVAVLDVDAHQGNGTQEIFYRRSDVRYGSVHVDPAAGWFPHFVGFEDEVGEGMGEGSNLNLPLSPGTGDEGFLAAVDRLVAFAGGADVLVVSLGLDAAADDPESPLMVTASGYAGAGRRLASLEVPTVIVQEGGYHIPTLGGLVTGFLQGFTDRDELDRQRHLGGPARPSSIFTGDWNVFSTGI